MVADYNGFYPKLYTEKLADNVKACMGFVISGNLGYVLNTLLNIDIRNISGNQYRVIATYRKNGDDDFYSEIVYRAKKVDWSRAKNPDEYQYLPKPE